MKTRTVYLVTSGDGSDGDEWQVLAIYSSMLKAENAKTAYEAVVITRHDGTTYHRYLNPVETWVLDPEQNVSSGKGYDFEPPGAIKFCNV